METNFDDPIARFEVRICYDCLKESQVSDYVLMANGDLAPLCLTCALKRKQAARERTGKDERPPE